MAKTATTTEVDHSQDIADLKQSVALLTQLVARMAEKASPADAQAATGQLAVVTAQLADATHPDARKRYHEREQSRHARDRALRMLAHERELLAGNRFYRVSIKGEPIMTRIVGATLEPKRNDSGKIVERNAEEQAFHDAGCIAQAQKKYYAYFGILSRDGAERQFPISFELLERLPEISETAAGEWDERQLNNLLAGIETERQIEAEKEQVKKERAELLAV